MRHTILYLTIALLLFQCKKEEFNDLGGTYVLKGIVVTSDTLNGILQQSVAKNYKVYLKYDTTLNGYLYSTTADAQGKFSFNAIDTTRKYTIYALSDTGAVKYYGEILYQSGQYKKLIPDTLKLIPSQTTQNGMRIFSGDASTQPIPNVTVWVFNNAALFAADSSAGRIFEINTNTYGAGYKLNIAPGTYYLRARANIGNLKLWGEDTVEVKAQGITPDTLTLRTNQTNRNGIEATVLDKYLLPVDKANVYAYRSQQIFENDTTSFSNSLFIMGSNGSGLAAVYMIEPGTYYLRAVKVINKDTLMQTGTINVTAEHISKLNLPLQ